MHTLVRRLVVGSALLLLTGCGATVGDACTVVGDCGGQALCLNVEYTPGGYCSRQCVLGDDTSCPNGSTCIRDGAAMDLHACFKTCVSNSDCRSGYTCQAIRANPQTVCVGPNA